MSHKIPLKHQIYKPNSEKPYSSMHRMSVYFPKEWIEEMTELVRKQEFPSIAALVRFALKNLLLEYRAGHYDRKQR